MNQKRKNGWQVFVLLSFILCLSSCKDDKSVNNRAFFDPSLEVKISGFNPESAGGGANFFVYGTNFGTDASIIKVSVNDKKAVVVSSDGTTIYCMIPEKSGVGPVKVTIGTEDRGIQEAVSQKDFQYEGKMRVSTLIGWTDKNNSSTTLDGSFDEAQFRDPAWLCFGETKDEIYVVEQVGTIRKIDLAKKEVTTLFSKSGALSGPRSLAFSPDYDTLYISNDQGAYDGMAVAYALKKEGYKKWARLANGKQCNGADVHPIDGTLFYNSFELGQLLKYNKETKQGDLLYRVGDRDWEYYVQFEPEGNFAYLVCRNRHYILKAFYDWENQTLVPPSVFVGTRGNDGGYVDGVGTSSRFHAPNQGSFDSKKNFYICDVDNHCIRKVTKDGLVTTFAGRAREWGYADGDLRNQAQFRYPVGIIYDEDKDVFYVTDCANHRIRTIKAE